ncbi:target of wingless [Carabus blaptoides fortunei]
MGCGQSKINIYPRKSKGKNNAKKIAADKPEDEEEENAENEQDSSPSLEESDGKKKLAKAKPHVGGPLLVQAELSSSQQNFFKMLDEKIEGGADYDANDETEIALETARLHTLLKDWETASVSSRSLPSTPRHIPRPQHVERPVQSAPKPANVIHQSYAQQHYRQSNYNPTYETHSPSHQPHYMPHVSGIQYQDYQPVSYTTPPNYQHPPTQTTVLQPRQYSVPSGGSPLHNSPKHKYAQPPHGGHGYVQNSPTHKMYMSGQPAPTYTNGELIIQQQLYNQQMQYQQTREYQLYRQSREQLLVQQQMQPGAGTRGSHYQSSVHVPIVSVLPPNEQSPQMVLQRKQQQQQRQYSQEMT